MPAAPTVEELERRVAALEQAVRRLTEAQSRPADKDWRRSLGMFAGDDVMREINRLGAEHRERDRREPAP